jgi:DNA-binding LacI/PurR family transcriptional regulator
MLQCGNLSREVAGFPDQEVFLATTAEPKYREVERQIRQNIREGVWRVGERIPAEHRISETFGVAYMTTRQAVGNLVSSGLLQRIPGKGTFVLASGDLPERDSSPAPALLVPALWERLDPYYFPEVLRGFQEGMGEAGRTATIQDYATADTEEFPVGGAAASRHPAIACLLLSRDETHLVDRLRDRGYPVLAINRYMGRRAVPSVAPDNAGGTALAVEHLVALGHQHIAFLKGNPGNLDAAERRRGFRAAMRRHGLNADCEAGDGFRDECGYRAAMALLSGPASPTALVCASDLAALGAIKAARERGLSVPEDLSVVGFGDFTIAEYAYPGLTTVRLPLRELGRCAADALLALVDGSPVANQVVSTHLVIRGTTAAAPLLSRHSTPVTVGSKKGLPS